MLLGAASAARAQTVEPLTLRVGDSAGAPGEVVGLVLRTYAPRAVGQGQVCIRPRPRRQVSGARAVETPFVELLGWRVFSVAGDAASKGSLAGTGPLVAFSSASAGINAVDGPLAVVYVRLASDLPPGTVYDVDLDALNTTLVDGAGQAIVVQPRAGTLTVLAPGAPLALAADDETPVGGPLTIGIDGARVLPLSSGRLSIELDPALADAVPTLVVDPRYGAVRWRRERGAANQIALRFESTGAELGMVPGPLVLIQFPGAVPPVGRPAATFLPGASWLFDANGHAVPLAID